VDYKVWSVKHKKVYKEQNKDVDELRSCIRDEMNQRVTDNREWRTRRGVLKRSEHKLSQ